MTIRRPYDNVYDEDRLNCDQVHHLAHKNDSLATEAAVKQQKIVNDFIFLVQRRINGKLTADEKRRLLGLPEETQASLMIEINCQYPNKQQAQILFLRTHLSDTRSPDY